MVSEMIDQKDITKFFTKNCFFHKMDFENSSGFWHFRLISVLIKETKPKETIELISREKKLHKGSLVQKNQELVGQKSA